MVISHFKIIIILMFADKAITVNEIDALIASELKFMCNALFIHNIYRIPLYVTGFAKIGLNAANNFFQYPWVKPYGLIFFENFLMAEMDRHQLALAYDAVVSSGVLYNSH